MIQTRGDNQIVVELPGVDDPEQAVDVLKETALLEIIYPGGASLPPGTIVQTSLGTVTDTAAATPSAATPDSDPAVAAPTPDPNLPVYDTIVSGSDLSDAFVTRDPTTGQPLVAFELSGDASDTFYDFTVEHIGQSMSIVVD
ncbi:MAG: protein translocase subunit SecD, partial [Chloroflexia bacterium]|nr:protein translocase subunit SecD [Chloroflexia bacterium]